jgi:hypothetical protein
MVATLQGAAALLFAAATPSPAAAQVAKVQKLTDSYRADTRLVAVATTGAHERRCVGATVGHFAVLTSYDCLAEWWNDTKSHRVGFTADQERRFASNGIERAWRQGGDARPWAIL